MSTTDLHVDLIRTLSMMVVITSVITVEVRRLRLSSVMYGIQALLIVALLLSFAAVNPALYWWAGTALITKAVLIPWFLFRYIGKTQETELRPLIGFGPSVVVAAVLMIGFFRLTHSYVDLLAHAELAQEEVFRTNLAVASTVFVVGLYAVLTRRDAVKTVIGLCLLENGVHLSLVSLAPEVSETALFGIATEVVVTVFLLLYVIHGVYLRFGTTDTLRLSELRG
ncbi:MAG: NADH-quinone oxidoreductase subunit K [Gemmatimonadota bacterium]|nr:MAG: NADH-quinone oxidoreductase subunit K [Gemmatimonadota bacterium]